MRGVVTVGAAALLLAGCHKEPDFNARFDKAQHELEASAKAIDRDIAASASASDAGSATQEAGEQAPPT